MYFINLCCTKVFLFTEFVLLDCAFNNLGLDRSTSDIANISFIFRDQKNNIESELCLITRAWSHLKKLSEFVSIAIGELFLLLYMGKKLRVESSKKFFV